MYCLKVITIFRLGEVLCWSRVLIVFVWCSLARVVLCAQTAGGASSAGRGGSLLAVPSTSARVPSGDPGDPSVTRLTRHRCDTSPAHRTASSWTRARPASSSGSAATAPRPRRSQPSTRPPSIWSRKDCPSGPRYGWTDGRTDGRTDRRTDGRCRLTVTPEGRYKLWIPDLSAYFFLADRLYQ